MKKDFNFSIGLFKKIAIVLTIVLISVSVTGQTMQGKEAFACMGLSKTSAFKKVQSIGSTYQGHDTDFYQFSKDMEYYSSDLTMALKNNNCNAKSWNVHILQASQIIGDVINSGFEVNEEATGYNMKAYKNYEKRLVLSLIERTSIDNMIIVTIGRMAANE